jgi:hypothetical protein
MQGITGKPHRLKLTKLFWDSKPPNYQFAHFQFSTSTCVVVTTLACLSSWETRVQSLLEPILKVFK